MTNEMDTGYAPDSWEFDEEVTRVFDDMLERSIPQYDVMRELVTDVATAFALRNSAVVDLGCSRGEALERVVHKLGTGWQGEFVGAEISSPMLQAARGRFGDDDRVRILEWDLRNGYPPVAGGSVSVTLSVLTLMFVPVNYRLQLLASAERVTLSGGALVVVDKVLGGSSRIDDVIQATYHRQKVENGYTPDDVNRKRLSLEGVLVPLTAEWNESMMRVAGFQSVDCFWGWGPFRAWLAVKA